MKIGIIGAGNIGTGLGRRLAAQGHDIAVCYARTPEKVAAAVALIGNDARASSVEEAAAHGDVVLLATPWGVTLDVVRGVAATLTGKTIWDTTNPFAPDMSELLIGTTSSAGEQIAAAAPGARVVKAIPPFAQLLHAESMTIHGHRPTVFLCGDDDTARNVIAELAGSIGLAPVVAGPLKLARFTEPAGMLVTNLAYVRGFGPRTSAILVSEPGDGG